METGETGKTPSLGPLHCSAYLFLLFALCLANLYVRSLQRDEMEHEIPNLYGFTQDLEIW